MAIIILAFHAAPVHKKIFRAIDYECKPPFGLGLDHQWLGFFQYATGGIFARYGSGTRDPFGEYGRSGNERVPVHVFDPRARWLIDHQEARPYGEASILGEEAAAARPRRRRKRVGGRRRRKAAPAGGPRGGRPGGGGGRAGGGPPL